MMKNHFAKQQSLQQTKGELVMARKSVTSIDLEIEQLKNRRKEILVRENEVKRKARTRRLIQRGVILEELIPEAETFTNEEIQEIVKYALNTPFVKEYLRKFQTLEVK